MEVSFSTAKLAKLCNSEKRLRAAYGPRMSRVIQRRLIDLRDAKKLEDLRNTPGRCHELKQDLKGLLAMDLVHPDRLVFKPDHDPIPKKPDGGLDWENITAVVVVGIGDYH